jgi:threonine/homoserine/homoserine lactone efflux protein
MDQLLPFILAAFALTGSPGPNTLGLAATGAAFGPRRGAAFLVGLIAGMCGVMVITATGVSGFLLAIPYAAEIVLAAAAAYFIYLAYRIATAPPLAEGAGDGRQPSFFGGVFLSLVNPKAYAAMAAVFSGFVLVADRLVLDIAVKFGALLVIITIVNVAWLFFGATLTRFFRHPRANRIINVIFAILLLASLAVTVLL